MPRLIPFRLLTFSLSTVVAAALFAVPAVSAEPLHTRIDRLLQTKPLGAQAGRCSDAEYLRRTSLALTGTIPTAGEARAFLADKSADKREKLVRRLLDSPEYLRHMTEFFDVMFTERRPAKTVKAAEWRSYLYDSLASGKPYNQLAAEILAGDTTDPKLRPAARFYFDRDAEPNQLTRDIGRIFFGKDLQCAQCHDHPLIDNYWQRDYYGLYAFVSRTYVFTDKKKKKTYLAERAEGNTAGFKSVFTGFGDTTRPRLPGGPQIDEPVFPQGAGYKQAKEGPSLPQYSRRARLAADATSGTNVAFNRNIVNRLWRLMFGRGLVEPVDLQHPDNPPAHPELLDLLAREFAAMKFDVKALLREIALTEIYQRSFELPHDMTGTMSPLAAQIPQLEGEAKRLDAAVAQASKAIEQIDKQLTPLKDAVTKAEGELDKSNAAITVARKKAAPAQKAVDTLKSQVAAKQGVLTAINAALASTGEVAKKLPKDKDIAAALATFKSKVARFNKDVAALNKALAAKQAALKPLAERVTAAQKAAETVIAKLQTARSKLAPVDKKMADATAKWKALQEDAKAAKRRLAYARAFVAHAQAKNALAQARKALAATAKKQAELDAQLAGLKKTLQPKLDAIAALEKQRTAAGQAVAAAKKLLAERQSIVASLAAAQKQAEAARAKLPKDADLTKAAATLKAKTAAYRKLAAEAQKAVATQQAAVKSLAAKVAAARKPIQSELADLDRKKNELAKVTEQLAAAKKRVEAQTVAVNETHAALSKHLTQRFQVRPLQPLSPEQLAWSMLEATGYADRIRRAEIAAAVARNKKRNPKYVIPTDPQQKAAFDRGIERAVTSKLKGNVGLFVRLFGAAAGQPQDEFFATVDQALFLSNGGQVRSWLSPAGTNLTARLLKMKDARAIADELYLSVLTRPASAEEVQDVADYLKGRDKDRAAALQELAWGLLTSAEFRFNH